MMSIDINPEMLVMARGIRGLTQKELANLSGIDQGNISRYEGDVKAVSEPDLEAIAEVLGFPSDFFLRTGQRRGPEASAIYHRKSRSTTKKELTPLDEHLNLFRLNVERLIQVADLEAPYTIPFYPVDSRAGIEKIEQIAADVRAAWKLPAGPIRNLMGVLEAASCFIHKIDFGTSRIDEIVQWLEPAPPVILVNAVAPGDRLRFSLAHALGHLVMHRDKAPYPEMEPQADQFAAAFLMPAEDIKDDLKPVKLDHLFNIKPTWKVSVQALIRRARDTGIIEERRYRSLFQMLSRMGYRKVEPFPVAQEEPFLFREMLRLYQEDLGYSITELATLLRMREEDFRIWYLPDTSKIRVLNRPQKRVSGK